MPCKNYRIDTKNLKENGKRNFIMSDNLKIFPLNLLIHLPTLLPSPLTNPFQTLPSSCLQIILLDPQNILFFLLPLFSFFFSNHPLSTLPTMFLLLVPFLYPFLPLPISFFQKPFLFISHRNPLLFLFLS